MKDLMGLRILPPDGIQLYYYNYSNSCVTFSGGVYQCRFAYKDEYEKFKLYLTIILLLGAVACRFVLHYR